VINVFNTVAGKKFSDQINQLINQRNESFAEKNNLMIELDPEIARAFE